MLKIDRKDILKNCLPSFISLEGDSDYTCDWKIVMDAILKPGWTEAPHLESSIGQFVQLSVTIELPTAITRTFSVWTWRFLINQINDWFQRSRRAPLEFSWCGPAPPPWRSVGGPCPPPMPTYCSSRSTTCPQPSPSPLALPPWGIPSSRPRRHPPLSRDQCSDRQHRSQVSCREKSLKNLALSWIF